MLDSENVPPAGLQVREKYQAVVKEIAEVRALGAEWLLLVLAGPAGGGTAKRQSDLLARLEAAEAMLARGVDALFADLKGRFPVPLEMARKEAREGLRDSLRRFKELSADQRAGKVTTHQVIEASQAHTAECGQGISAFLRELNAMVAVAETQSIEAQVKLVKKTIEDIKRLNLQISLIAFNASVEAARAGDTGRSFSVIATEIQALSMKSKTAFEDLKTNLG